MPHINPNKCYTVTPQPVIADTPLNVDELAALLSSFSNLTKEEIKRYLDRFVGPQGTYTYKAGLIESLRIVFIHLQKTEVLVDEKRLIADKLIEGVGFCTPGFHNRVNSIILGLVRPRSIDAILERVRQSIVESIARSYTGDVHRHNSFFSAAATLGYGVRPINRQDVYSGFINPEQLRVLQKTFAEKYTALSILNDLQVNIEGELRSYFDYQGKKTIDAPYNRGQIDRMVEFLNTILGSSYTERQFFIWEANESMCCDVQIDINWAFIQACLWEKLKNERYITLSKEEVNLFHALYHTEQTSLASLLKEPRYRKLLYAFDFIKYPQIIKSFEQRKIMAAALAEQASGMNIEELLRYTQLIQTFFSDDSTLKKQYLQIAAETWLKNRKNLNLISTIKLGDQKTLLVIYENLSDQQLKALFSKPSLALENLLLLSAFHSTELSIRLMYLVKDLYQSTPKAISLLLHALNLTLEHQPEAAPKIIDFMKSLEPSMQRRLFAEKNINGDSALMVAVNKKPAALPHLLTLIKTFDDETQKAILRAKDKEGSNVLILATRNQPPSLPHLLAFIKTFDIETQKAMLAEKNTYGNNALIFAAEKEPETIDQLLELIKTFDVETQKAILATQSEEDGCSALMIAAYFQPEITSHLLDFIKTFDVETQKAILTAKTNQGENALIKALHKKPLAAIHLLNFIKTFDLETQEAILTMTDMLGNQPLIIATYTNPVAFPVLIDLIKQLDIEKQKAMLTATDPNGNSVLAIAAHRRPTAIPYLLDVIRTFDIETQKTMLAAKNGEGNNALMKVTSGNIAALTPLLEFIKTFDIETQKAILTATDRNGNNVLTIAAHRQPTAIPPLLDVVRTFDIETQKAMLTAKNREGQNALMMAASADATALPPLIEFIKTFDVETQKAILTARDCMWDNALMLFVGSSKSIGFSQFLDFIKTFDIETQENILTTKNNMDKNALMISLYRSGTYSELLSLIKTFDPEKQRTILAAKDAHGKNALLIAAICQPTALPELLKCLTPLGVETQKKIGTAKSAFVGTWHELDAITIALRAPDVDKAQILDSISGYGLEAKLEILKQSSKHFPALKARRQKLIDGAMNALKQGSPLEKVIYQQLQSMRFNANSKREAILAAIDAIRKSGPTDMDTAIKEVIAEPTSGLRQALSQRRYCLFPPMTSQTRSLEKVIEAANPRGFVR
jgi:ankyrin repeat protein